MSSDSLRERGGRKGVESFFSILGGGGWGGGKKSEEKEKGEGKEGRGEGGRRGDLRITIQSLLNDLQ